MTDYIKPWYDLHFAHNLFICYPILIGFFYVMLIISSVLSSLQYLVKYIALNVKIHIYLYNHFQR